MQSPSLRLQCASSISACNRRQTTPSELVSSSEATNDRVSWFLLLLFIAVGYHYRYQAVSSIFAHKDLTFLAQGLSFPRHSHSKGRFLPVLEVDSAGLYLRAHVNEFPWQRPYPHDINSDAAEEPRVERERFLSTLGNSRHDIFPFPSVRRLTSVACEPPGCLGMMALYEALLKHLELVCLQRLRGKAQVLCLWTSARGVTLVS